MSFEKIAVMGGGSWATALAKLLLRNCDSILWYMRRDDRIEDFKRIGHNPAYLTDVEFDVKRIEFSSDINYVCSHADTLLLVMPSPYFKSHINKINVDLSSHTIVSAVKGIVPGDNEIFSDYMVNNFGVNHSTVRVSLLSAAITWHLPRSSEQNSIRPLRELSPQAMSRV